MIVNMACPKCGGQSTEYDDKKWSCLRCGNKFVYEPTQASHTLVQSNVHIQGQATFELDVENAKSPSPKMVKMIEYDPSFYGKQIEAKKSAIAASKVIKYPIYILQVVCLSACVLLGLIGLLCIYSLLFYSQDDTVGGIIAVSGLGVIIIISFLLFRKFRKRIKYQDLIIDQCQQAIYSLEHENQMDTKVGDYIVCPHCETPFEFVALNSTPPVESLKHCLNCGRQFFTSGLNSYPARFK
jgi:DNA-directed RNA polymerase subunit RPC12/RpoP